MSIPPPPSPSLWAVNRLCEGVVFEVHGNGAAGTELSGAGDPPPHSGSGVRADGGVGDRQLPPRVLQRQRERRGGVCAIISGLGLEEGRGEGGGGYYSFRACIDGERFCVSVFSPPFFMPFLLWVRGVSKRVGGWVGG